MATWGRGEVPPAPEVRSSTQRAAGRPLQDPGPPARLVSPHPPHHRPALWLWGAPGPSGHLLPGPDREGRAPPHPKWIRESCCGRGQVLGQREPVNRLHPQAGSCRQLLIPRCFRLKDVQRVDGAGPCRLGNSHLAACAWQLPGQTAGDLRAPGLGALPPAGPPAGHAGVVDATARVCPGEGPEGGGCGPSPPGAQGLLVRAASVPRALIPPAVGGLVGRVAAVCAL